MPEVLVTEEVNSVSTIRRLTLANAIVNEGQGVPHDFFYDMRCAIDRLLANPK
jgi:hypothetical protein